MFYLQRPCLRHLKCRKGLHGLPFMEDRHYMARAVHTLPTTWSKLQNRFLHCIHSQTSARIPGFRSHLLGKSRHRSPCFANRPPGEFDLTLPRVATRLSVQHARTPNQPMSGYMHQLPIFSISTKYCKTAVRSSLIPIGIGPPSKKKCGFPFRFPFSLLPPKRFPQTRRATNPSGACERLLSVCFKS